MRNEPILKESLQLYKRLFPFVTPYWRTFIIVGICTLPLSLCSAAIAYLVKPALDEVFLKKDLQMLMLIPLAVIVLYSIRAVFEYTYNFLLGSIGHRIMNDIRTRIYYHLQTLSLSFFIKNPTGMLISRITNDVNFLQLAINKAVVSIIKESFTVIGLTGVLFYHDVRLAGISFLILPWAAIPIWRFGQKGRRFSTRGQEKIGKIATFMHETITGCRIVKAFGMEEYENERFYKESKRLLRIRLKRLKLRSLSGPLMELIGGGAGAAVMFYGGYNVLHGTSTPGTFFSFVAALLLLYGPARNISTAYQDIQEGLAAAKRIFYIFDTEPDVREKAGARPLPRAAGAVAFSRVDFAYEDKPVLRDITLDAKPGESIAIVGMTGSGKTTLVNLIPRFFDVTAGTVRIDNTNIRDVTIASLRSQISFVSQHAYLFNDTVQSNISYGDPSQTRQQVIEAAKKAHAHEFISSLPERYDTVIGEHGVKLSGGQRQRIAIARAILKNAPVLILDEATASLDSQLEEKIQHSIQGLIKNRTTFIISHRLSTIKNAHRIIVLAQGRIVEQGTHDELFQRGGEYTKLYSIYLQEGRKAVQEPG